MSALPRYKFRLYLGGDTQNSVQAIANLREICRMHLPDQHEIELVDVFRDPKRALDDGILMTPTLVKLEPPPVVRIVGNLSQTEFVLQALGLGTISAQASSDQRLRA